MATNKELSHRVARLEEDHNNIQRSLSRHTDVIGSITNTLSIYDDKLRELNRTSRHEDCDVNGLKSDMANIKSAVNNCESRSNTFAPREWLSQTAAKVDAMRVQVDSMEKRLRWIEEHLMALGKD